jgi:hypothetical protein
VCKVSNYSLLACDDEGNVLNKAGSCLCAIQLLFIELCVIRVDKPVGTLRLSIEYKTLLSKVGFFVLFLSTRFF